MPYLAGTGSHIGDSCLVDDDARFDSWLGEHFGRILAMRKLPGAEDFTTFKGLVE